MKILATLLTLTLIITVNVNAQTSANKQTSAQKEADKINELLEMVADVSPFYSPEEVKEFISDYEKYSPQGDVWEIIDSCNNGIIYHLQKLIENETYNNITTSEMINTNKIYSPDSSVIIHSWYSNNGGTFMMYYNMAEVKLPNGKKQFVELDYLGNLYETGFVPTTDYATFYFIGTTKGCSSYYEHSVMIYSVTENGLAAMDLFENVNTDINYAFATYFRGWDFENNYISYNEIDHSFEYAHKNDDASEQEIFYEEGRWIFDGNLFRQEISMQLDRNEFLNLFGDADNN